MSIPCCFLFFASRINVLGTCLQVKNTNFNQWGDDCVWPDPTRPVWAATIQSGVTNQLQPSCRHTIARTVCSELIDYRYVARQEVNYVVWSTRINNGQSINFILYNCSWCPFMYHSFMNEWMHQSSIINQCFKFLSVYLRIRIFIEELICLTIYQPDRVFLSVCLSVYLSVIRYAETSCVLYVFLCIFRSVYIYVCQNVRI